MEGPRLLEAALDAGAEVEAVFVDATAASQGGVAPSVERAREAGARVFHLAPGVLERVADTVTPQPVLAIVHGDDPGLEVLSGATFVVVCHDVRDPGNAGTIIRSAAGAGADAVVCCGGCVDPWNPKAVRASAGAVLQLPVVSGAALEEVLAVLGGEGIACFATATEGGDHYSEVDWSGPVALVLGNEAAGLPTALGGRLEGTVSIPTAQATESLNVAMAATVLCFEVRRQRSAAAGSAGHASAPGRGPNLRDVQSRLAGLPGPPPR